MSQRSGTSIFTDGAIGGANADSPFTGVTYDPLSAVNGFGNRLTLGDITTKNGNIFLTEVQKLVEIVSNFDSKPFQSILGSLILGQPFEPVQWKTLSNNCKMYEINLGIFKDKNLICNFDSDGLIWVGTDDGTLQEMRLGSTKPSECPPSIETPSICSTAQDLTQNLESMAAKATTPVVSEAGADTKFRTSNTYHIFNSRPKLNMDSTLTPRSGKNVVYASANLGNIILMAWIPSVVKPNTTLQELMTNYTPINNEIKIQSFETLKQDIDSLLTKIFKLINDPAIDIERFPKGFVEGYRFGFKNAYEYSGYLSLQDINIYYSPYYYQNINNNSDLFKIAWELGFYFSYNILYNFYIINGGEIIGGNIQNSGISDPEEFSKLMLKKFFFSSYKEGTFKDGLKNGLKKGFIDAEISASNNNIQLQDVHNPKTNEVIYNDGYILGYWIGWNFIMKIKGLRLQYVP